MKRYKRWFECFFGSISDFYKAHRTISIKLHCLIEQYFILNESIICKNSQIKVKEGEIYFCFQFSVSNVLYQNRTQEDVDEIVQNAMELDFFTNRSRNNFICEAKDILTERGEYNELEGAKYFFDDMELIKYSHKHKLFKIEDIPKDISPIINGIIRTSDGFIEERKRTQYKRLGVSKEYIDHFDSD